MMKPPTPTTTPIIVFLVLLLSPPPEEDEPLSVREAELDGEAEELVAEEDVEESLLVLDAEVVGGVVEAGVVEDCEGLVVELELELDEDEEGELVVCAALEVELELLLEGVVVGGLVEEVGVDVSEAELVGVVDVLLAESDEELLSVGSFPLKAVSSPERPSWRPRMFGLAIVAWVTAIAARTATSDCARKSMMRMLMDR